jgi:thiopurine S-methyltransferase
MLNLDENYWSGRYQTQNTGWDVGSVSTPLKEFFDSLTNKNLKILVPGAGNGYEVEYLHHKEFKNIYLLDFAKEPLENFKSRNPEFPNEFLIQEDFFAHSGKYDLIIEQTFFCALTPSLRENYAEKMGRLLKPEGRLVGLLFNDPLNTDRPPFGGSRKEYEALFTNYFAEVKLEEAHNSISPRAGRELWLEASRPKLNSQ